MASIEHPYGGPPIEGEKLKPGSTIQAEDYYASTDGTWRPAAGLAGQDVLASENVIWVCPAA